MKLRLLAVKLFLSRLVWNFKVGFIRITWTCIVFPIYIRYARWINRQLEKGHIEPEKFIRYTDISIDYDEFDRYDGLDRHAR